MLCTVHHMLDRLALSIKLLELADEICYVEVVDKLLAGGLQLMVGRLVHSCYHCGRHTHLTLR